MQAPDSHSVADKTGETSAQDVASGRERALGPSLPVAGTSGERASIDLALHLQEARPASLPRHHYGGVGNSGQRKEREGSRTVVLRGL